MLCDTLYSLPLFLYDQLDEQDIVDKAIIYSKVLIDSLVLTYKNKQ